jgi:hypothetical protein
MVTNFCGDIIKRGGKLIPLVFAPKDFEGTGLMNPSVYNDNGRLLINVRQTNYTLWHCENEQLFNSRYGPLVYFNPEDDVRLATKNYICTLNQDLTLKEYFITHTEKLDNPHPLWEFHGLEDARLFRWNNKLFQSGVRRDTTPNGEGRMELSEIVLTDFECTEVSRQRIPMPEGEKSYCEKNWVPIIDMPFHYVKWTNPTQIIKYDPINKTTTVVISVDNKIEGIEGLRGGSQVIPYKDYHITLVHEVDLFNNIQEQKDCFYRHRFIVWDKDWNIVYISDAFSFMDARIEFSCGMCLYNGDLLITFGFQDNAAFLLQIPEKEIDDAIGVREIGKLKHIYTGSEFGEDWFTYPILYSQMVNKFPTGSRFVEVGCYKGKSSAYMATEIANSIKNISFYCVDRWEDGEDVFKKNMETLSKYYCPIRSSSLEAAKTFEDRSLDFVFIDASHEYEDVKNDILAWLPKVKIGGILAGHDYFEDQSYHPGVFKAVTELVNGFEISEKCWIHEVKDKNKLDGFPSVYSLSLYESKDRRENLKKHFKSYNIIPRFCTFDRYEDGKFNIIGSNIDKVNLHAKGSNISNLKTILKWYTDTNEDYGFICEDDLSLETVQYWPFTWKEFISRLPLDWECVQLLQIRDGFNTHKLKIREKDDYCNAAYIVKRDYARKLFDKYFTSTGYNFECEGIPVPENILFTLGKVYSIPLFVEDVPNTETTFSNGKKHSDMHEYSYTQISNFWKNEGDRYTINDFIPEVESWRSIKDPIFEITTNILTHGCVNNCVFCPQRTLISNYTGNRLLTLEEFKKVADKIPIEIGIIFAGFSEPWLNPECTDMVLYAHSIGHKVSIFTTGVGMTTTDVDRLKNIPFASGPNRGFTLHIPDKEGYANHPTTKKYIDLLEYIRESNIAHLRVMSMGTVPDNLRHIFPYVQIAQMFSRAGNLKKEETLKPRLIELRDKYLSTDNGEGDISCASPEGTHHMVMLPNGDVAICCQDYDLKHIIGNIFTQEYKDIVPNKDTPFDLCRYCENGKRN